MNCGAFTAAFHESVSLQIQAKFDAARMKARRPIELALGLKIMPLETVTHATKTAEDRLPARAHIAPSGGFSEACFRGVRFF